MDYIGVPPQEKKIPVTKGCDRLFTIQRLDSDGDPQAFENGSQVYMWVDIDKAAPTQVNATVSGSQAAFNIQSTVLDLVKTGTRFRIVLDIANTEIPLLVGRFERHDG